MFNPAKAGFSFFCGGGGFVFCGKATKNDFIRFYSIAAFLFFFFSPFLALILPHFWAVYVKLS
jgi:hypothetical protein